ncbi:MAG TPA: creatininase family protein [Candidatus Acidoferrum sp.]|jgi:creatinine amidohydrolase|nr:creatininase family protein [Candidatus Acidoferrum sp.]
MLRWAIGIFVVGVASVCCAQGQTKLSAKWEELTAEEFRQAIGKAERTCLLPFGILEKHGPHLPLGTDLLNVRYVTEHAVQQEYAVIFPDYYFGQIAEARHEPGTVAYSAEMQMKLLQATTDEMGRNGCKKVIIVNGHGGNENLLPYFAQTQLDAPHEYVVYVQWGHDATKKARAEKNGPDWHAGETETSNMLVTHPNLAHMDRANNESGADQKRMRLPENVYTGIWWYARFPNHYSGDGSTATKEQGEEDLQAWITTVVRAIRAVKADEESLKLQNEFYEKSRKPMETVH